MIFLGIFSAGYDQSAAAQKTSHERTMQKIGRETETPPFS